MKKEFLSKISNCQINLRPGIPGERLTGRIAIPGLHVRFQDGKATVDSESQKEIYELMIAHPGFKSDFDIAEDGVEDPYLEQRGSSEPQHDIQQIKHGSVVGTQRDKVPVQFSKEQKSIIKEMVSEITSSLKDEITTLTDENKTLKGNGALKTEKSDESEKQDSGEQTKEGASVVKTVNKTVNKTPAAPKK